jgi:hypothetical protein
MEPITLEPSIGVDRIFGTRPDPASHHDLKVVTNDGEYLSSLS